MSRHLERLLQIDTLLRSRERQTTESLAQTLEVSERTIRSDLAFLRDRYSAPIVSNDSDIGGSYNSYSCFERSHRDNNK